ncbi:MAG: hypothetical protein ACRD8O_14665 [Bryobacteraceae bacterium]
MSERLARLTARPPRNRQRLALLLDHIADRAGLLPFPHDLVEALVQTLEAFGGEPLLFGS